MFLNLTNLIIGSFVLFVIALFCTNVFKNLSSYFRSIIWMMYLLSLPLVTFTIFSENDKATIINVPDHYLQIVNERESSPSSLYNPLPERTFNEVKPKANLSISFFIWISGALFLIGRLIYSSYIISKISRKAVPFLDYQLLNAPYSQVIPIHMSKEINVPGVYGFFSQKIIFPEQAYNWDAEETKYVCLHEYSHLVNCHIVINNFARITRALYWFLPFSWMAYSHLRSEQENISDEFILRSGNSNLSYANSLLSLTQKFTQKDRFHESVVPSIKHGSQITLRIKRILKYTNKSEKHGRRWLSLSLSLILCTLFCLSTIQCFSVEHRDLGKIIEFEDPNLERAILGRSAFQWSKINNYRIDTNKDEKISIGEALEVRFLDVEGDNIQSLKGIEYFENLEELVIGQNPIRDVTPLSQLVHLKDLNLWDLGISDISFLAPLQELTGLELEGNAVNDISILSRLNNLVYLSLFANQVVDISPIKDLKHLRFLYLDYNDVEDISALKNLQKLEILMINNNPVKNLEPIQSLENLRFLTLSSYQTEDITFLAEMPSLREVSIWDMDVDLSPQDLIKGVDFEKEE